MEKSIKQKSDLVTLFLALLTLVFVSSCDSLDVENNDFKIIAHRGYWKAVDGAENSIASLRAAANLGIDGVELDVRITKDDSLILMHDGDWGGHDIASSTLEEIRSTRLPNGEQVPTLREYMLEAKEHPGMMLFMDVKYPELCVKIKQLAEGLYLPNPIVYATNISTASELKKTGNVIAVCSGNVNADKLVEAGVDGFSALLDDLKSSPSNITDANNKGLMTVGSVVNVESELIWCVNNGVRHIITNDPFTAINFRSECR